MAPVYCMGETLEEREAGKTRDVLARQMGAFDGFAQAPASLVIAYEPVWAIGTGRAATPAMAAEAHSEIRRLLGDRFGAETAETTRILYGGSVTPDNASALFREAEVDGGLVGGASLEAASFREIVRAAARD
jgi:triosephosphate isomerase